jgi:oligopeptide transport system substrate-binding protein
LLKDIPGQVYTPPQLGTYYYALNTQKGPTADPRVRLALSMTVDRRVMAEKVLGTGKNRPGDLHRTSPQGLNRSRRHSKR